MKYYYLLCTTSGPCHAAEKPLSAPTDSRTEKWNFSPHGKRRSRPHPMRQRPPFFSSADTGSAVALINLHLYFDFLHNTIFIKIETIEIFSVPIGQILAFF